MTNGSAVTPFLITERTYLVRVESLDESTAPLVVAAIRRLLDEGAQEIVVDLLDVGGIDSVAIASLARLGKAADRAGATLTLVCDDEDVLRLFELVGILRAVACEATVPAAFAGVPSRARAPADAA